MISIGYTMSMAIAETSPEKWTEAVRILKKVAGSGRIEQKDRTP